MKSFIAAAAAIALTAGAAPAFAQQGVEAKSPEVVERDAQGKASKIRIGNVIYEVCMSERQDHCINPRAAGLSWGDRPLDYWPGERRS